MNEQIEVQDYATYSTIKTDIRAGEEYYYFALYAPNHEIIAQSEQYTDKHNVIDLLEKYFPTFPIRNK